jgi:hypothetical protein
LASVFRRTTAWVLETKGYFVNSENARTKTFKKKAREGFIRRGRWKVDGTVGDFVNSEKACTKTFKKKAGRGFIRRSRWKVDGKVGEAIIVYSKYLLVQRQLRTRQEGIY